jgi:hypothetical protein
MSRTDNLRDLQRHARDFAARRGFTYTVLSIGAGDVIGCVYIYPPGSQGPGDGERRLHASVESWVRADHAALDPAVHDAVAGWLGTRLAVRFDRVRSADLICAARTSAPPATLCRSWARHTPIPGSSGATMLPLTGPQTLRVQPEHPDLRATRGHPVGREWRA